MNKQIQSIIVTLKQSDPFARVSKEMLDNPKLSWKSKGILAYLLGKPEHWVIRTTDIERRSTDGHGAIRTALNELRLAGYAKLTQIREEGRITGWAYKVSDRPVFITPKLEVKNRNLDQECNNEILELECKNYTLSKNEEKRSSKNKNKNESGKAAAQLALSEKHHHFVKLWCESYQEHFGHKYAFQGGKDGQHVKHLLRNSEESPDDLINIARQAWSQPSNSKCFWCGKSYSLSVFASHFNEVRVELSGSGIKRKSPTASGGWTSSEDDLHSQLIERYSEL